MRQPRNKTRWETMYRTTGIPLSDAALDEHIRLAREQMNLEFTREQIREQLESEDELWTNRVFQCAVFYLQPQIGPLGWLHLSIKRRSKAVIRDWRELQRVKNDVAGPEREAFEIFPAESRLVDTANQYHLWAMPFGEKIDLGFNTRAVFSDVGLTGARQRKL